MDNERLTPFDSLEPRFKESPQVESVDDLIARRKALKKRLKKIRWIKRIGVFFLTIALAFLSYAYVVTPMSRISRIEIVGNRMLSKQSLLQTLKITVGTPLYATDLVILNEELLSIDLVASGSVLLSDHNTIKIELTEKRGVALILQSQALTMLTDNAEFITMDAGRLIQNMNLPLIVGITDSDELGALARVLGTLNDEILVNISEIHKEKILFNEPQLRLMMQGGNIVFAPLSALSALDKYLQVVKMTNPTDSCFSIADISFSLVKLDCPTY